MATGINQDGKVVKVNDAVSITATVISFTGTGSTALVTAGTAWSPNTFVFQASDCEAVQHSNDAAHAALSITGKNFGTSGDFATVLGVCTAIVGSGVTASLTVLLKTSGMVATVPAGSVRSDNV